MAPKHNQINLLPDRWRVPTKLSEVQKKLHLISLTIMGIYIAIVVGVLGWLGFLKVRQFQIGSDIKNVSSQLAKFHHVEAAQELLEGKTSYGLNIFQNKLNPGIAISKGAKLFTDSLQLIQLSADSTGKLGLVGVATNSATAGSATALSEDPQGQGRKLFAKALAVLDRDRQSKITLSFDFKLIPSVPLVDLSK